jgi:class 3 adenylate cyclase
MTYRMRSLSAPLVSAHRGRIVKAEADNLYCLFPDVAEAIAASAAIGRRMEAANEALADDRKLYASIGIGYGRILNIGDRDFYGDEVNFASKLGEDIAKRGEILLTQGAFARLVGTAVETRQVSRVVSEMAMTYYHALPRAA